LPSTGVQPWTEVYVSNTRCCDELRSGAGLTEGRKEERGERTQESHARALLKYSGDMYRLVASSSGGPRSLHICHTTTIQYIVVFEDIH